MAGITQPTSEYPLKKPGIIHTSYSVNYAIMPQLSVAGKTGH